MPTRRALALAALALPARAQAQGIEGGITLVVPFTPGTTQDILARLIAPYLQARLDHPAVVDNRAGASGNIGTVAVSRAAPDGRTLLVQANTFVTTVPLFTPQPYDPDTAFSPLILLAENDLVLSVPAELPVVDLAGFLALARTRPIDYGSPGIGTPQHLAMALLALEAGVELNHIPYRGSAPAVQDLIAARVQAVALPITTALPLAEQGRIRMLAVGSRQRVAAAPGVPTFVECGFPNVEVGFWYAVFGPPGMAPALVARFNRLLNEWLREPETLARLAQQGLRPLGGPPAVLAQRVHDDFPRWTRVIREAKIRAE